MREPRIAKEVEKARARPLPKRSVQDVVPDGPDYLGAGYRPPQHFAPLLSQLAGPANLTRRSRLLKRMQQTYGNRYAERAVLASQHSVGTEEMAGQSERASLDRLLDIVKRKRATNVLDWAALASCLNDAAAPLAERSMLALAVRSAHGDEVMVQLMELTPQGKALHSYVMSAELQQASPTTARQDEANAGRLVYRLRRAEGGGVPMSAGTRKEMESLMVSRFGDVRIHVDEQAASLASALNVQAFTLGKDIFFGKGCYQPATASGKGLLAHELAHVVQQQYAGPRSVGPIRRRGAGSALEKEAHRAAVAVACGLPMLVTARTSSMSLQGAAVVLSSAIPTNRSGIQNSGGHVHESFEMHIDWDPAHGTPGDGEYRQYIKGYFKVNGVKMNKPLWGGANLEETVYHEDGTGGAFRYGHRAEAGSDTDVFDNPDRATGSRYRGWDDPGMTGPAGTNVDFSLTFKGQTYDTSTSTHGPENIWTVAFAGAIA